MILKRRKWTSDSKKSFACIIKLTVQEVSTSLETDWMALLYISNAVRCHLPYGKETKSVPSNEGVCDIHLTAKFQEGMFIVNDQTRSLDIKYYPGLKDIGGDGHHCCPTKRPLKPPDYDVTDENNLHCSILLKSVLSPNGQI